MKKVSILNLEMKNSVFLLLNYFTSHFHIQLTQQIAIKIVCAYYPVISEGREPMGVFVKI